MVGELAGNVMSLQLDVHEVHRERELVTVQHAVPVDVGQLPDLPEGRVRQPTLDHLRLGRGTGHLPVDGVEALEDIVVLVPILRHNPLSFPSTLVNALPDPDAKRAVLHAVKRPALDTWVGGAHLLLVRNHLHEACDVLGEHAINLFDELRLEGVELGEVLVGQHLLHVLHLREVSEGDLVFLLQLTVDLWQVRNQLLLLRLLPEHRWHLTLQVRDDVRVHLRTDNGVDYRCVMIHAAAGSKTNCRTSVKGLYMERVFYLLVHS